MSLTGKHMYSKDISFLMQVQGQNVLRYKVRGGKVKLLMKKDQRCIFKWAANWFCAKMTFDVYKDDTRLLDTKTSVSEWVSKKPRYRDNSYLKISFYTTIKIHMIFKEKYKNAF